MKISVLYEDLEHLIGNSDLVLEATVIENVELIEGSVTYVVSEVKVNDILKGELTDKESIIRIIQTVSYEDPLLQKGEKKILFLKEYIGPRTKDAYIITGAYQGNYNISQNDDVTLSYVLDESTLEFSKNQKKDAFSKIIKDKSSNK